MGPHQLTLQESSDLTWFCRRLAAALQADPAIPAALEAMSREAPKALRPRLAATRPRVLAGQLLAEALVDWDLPPFLWATIKRGDSAHALPATLHRIADRIEVEQTAPPRADARLRDYSLALGRLGLLLSSYFDLDEAAAVAAESVAPSEASEVLGAVCDAIRDGDVTFAAALARLAPDLPPLTSEMIRDAEEQRRLGAALPIISDYLLDEAGLAARRTEAEHAA